MNSMLGKMMCLFGICHDYAKSPAWQDSEIFPIGDCPLLKHPTMTAEGRTVLQWSGASECANPRTSTLQLFGRRLAQSHSLFISSAHSLMRHQACCCLGAGPQHISEVGRLGYGKQWRLPLQGESGAELARVLGGGVVPGSLTLVGGDPGKPAISLLPCHPSFMSMCWRKHAHFVWTGSEQHAPQPLPHTKGW